MKCSLWTAGTAECANHMVSTNDYWKNPELMSRPTAPCLVQIRSSVELGQSVYRGNSNSIELTIISKIN